MKHSILVLIGSILLMNCTRPERTLDLQGHRGARGLFPENSLLGFEKALEIPEVSTLELDLCVTADHELVISHEPWFNETICTLKDSAHEGPSFSLYKMTYDSIKAFDCGSKGHPDFPEQQNAIQSKPLLKDLFAMIADKGLRWPYPEADVFNKVCIQSFDPRALREVRKTALPVKLSLITEKTADPAKEMNALGFPVDIYSPSYELVTPELISWCHFRQIAVIPWTINDVSEMQKLVDMGVDGIISDYPNKFKALVY